MVRKKVRDTIIRHNLINKGDKVLIALSGGADSVCLTHVLRSLSGELGIELMTAHLNHNIRGGEAIRDFEFAGEFSRNLNIACKRKSVMVRKIAAERGISEETAGRNERYAFFREITEEYGFNKIATAHNRNDNAETIVMNFMRGSSEAGLSGIPYRRDNIIRPLLDVTREEIEEYCSEHNLSFVTDSTNAEDNYTRNKIRHRLIPMIESEFNPNFINTASQNGLIMRDEEDYISSAAEEKYKKLVKDNSVEINALLKCPRAIIRRIIRLMIAEVTDIADLSMDFTEKVTELSRKGKTGSHIMLPKGAAARIEYGRLIIERSAEAVGDYDYALPLGTDVYIKEAGVTIRAERAVMRKDDGAKYFSGVDESALRVRNRRAGDYFYPLGMDGKKKLKEYFIDEKIPRQKRNVLPLITSGGDIIYVYPRRSDRRFTFSDTGIKITIT